MYRRFAMAVLACALLAGGLQQAMAESTVDIVVVGYINHGPMQPTVDAIRNGCTSLICQPSVAPARCSGWTWRRRTGRNTWLSMASMRT